MESYLLDWANLLLRWVHVITAIAWIGSSFYFVFLDSSLTPPEDEDLKKQGVSGELWAVHGGGFYHPVKFAGAPPQAAGQFALVLLGELQHLAHRFFAVHDLVFVECRYLPDRQVRDGLAPTCRHCRGAGHFWWCSGWRMTPYAASLASAKTATPSWARWSAVLVCVASYLACHWFAGRAAFLLVGAMMATAMSANVFFWIIPGQRTMVADIAAGRSVDPIHGKRGKQRSVHNTYFTLPVLFAMLSNHYSFTYSHPQNWLVLIVMMFAGAAIRQFFVLRHGYKLGRNSHPWPYAAAGVVAILGMLVWLKPAPPAQDATNSGAAGAVTTGATATIGYKEMQPMLAQRCYMCHGEAVQMKNVRLDSPQALASHAQTVYQQVVVTKIMPMSNATNMTDDERLMVKQWFEAGAKTE